MRGLKSKTLSTQATAKYFKVTRRRIQVNMFLWQDVNWSHPAQSRQQT